MFVADGMGVVLQQHRLAGAQRRHDQGALALALRGDQVDDAGRKVALRAAGEDLLALAALAARLDHRGLAGLGRSEEHTSELQSLMRISYAVFWLKKKTR